MKKEITFTMTTQNDIKFILSKMDIMTIFEQQNHENNGDN